MIGNRAVRISQGCEKELFPRVFEHGEFLAALPGMELMWGEPLARHTTMRVGGPVACLARPQSLDALEILLGELTRRRVPWIVLGGGSNVLAPDEPWDVVVVQLKAACSHISIVDPGPGNGAPDVLVHVGAGVILSSLLRFCVQKGLGGAEFLAGIPGTLGGALVMNAGAAGRDISEILHWVETMDAGGRTWKQTREELPCSYRSMGIPEGRIVLGACLGLQPGPRGRIKQELAEKIAWRRKTQPRGGSSAGCIFKNPPGGRAGALIDQAGLKGTRMGGATVSEKHANWILNTGSATSADILRLMEHVEASVLQRFGIRLEREVQVLGAWSSRGELHG